MSIEFFVAEYECGCRFTFKKYVVIAHWLCDKHYKQRKDAD